MLEALDEAKRFRGYCAPNPSVGAIAVRGQDVLARAAHQGAGTPHAEINLLNQLEGDLSDVRLYVTLEPCNHWGRTPPCVKQIIERNVSQIIYGFADPNPVVKQNDTPKILRENGIEVIHFPMPEIDQFYQSYHYWTHHHRPWVTAKMAISLDGRIANKGNQPFQLSNELCRTHTHLHRDSSDIILTSAATILADDPLLNVRINEKETSKPLAVVDSDLSVPKVAKAIQAAKIVLQFHQPEATVASAVTKHHFSVPKNQFGLDMDAVIRLIGEQGYHDVWVEAGGKLFSYLHQHKLVQTTYLYVSPHVLGNQAISAFSDMPNWTEEKPVVNWQIMDDNAILRLDW
jgi:diaminohydroxyphosphoribosylaminopyrimidine deaminase/5-amino-6-(5-phosphoribosylamino)uracil reductase